MDKEMKKLRKRVKELEGFQACAADDIAKMWEQNLDRNDCINRLIGLTEKLTEHVKALTPSDGTVTKMPDGTVVKMPDGTISVTVYDPEPGKIYKRKINIPTADGPWGTTSQSHEWTGIKVERDLEAEAKHAAAEKEIDEAEAKHAAAEKEIDEAEAKHAIGDQLADAKTTTWGERAVKNMFDFESLLESILKQRPVPVGAKVVVVWDCDIHKAFLPDDESSLVYDYGEIRRTSGGSAIVVLNSVDEEHQPRVEPLLKKADLI